MSIFKKNSKDEHPDDEHVDSRPSHEGIRPKTCASRLRHLRTCTCGRQRALTRTGQRHWVRLSACAYCLRAAAQASSAASGDSRKAVDRG
jgi:hypothetical protein